VSYVAVDRDIWTSTVLKEGPLVVATWLLLMADSDRHGITSATPTAIASVLRVEDEAVEKAFETLMAPDKRSRNRDEDGRRMIDLGDGRYELVSFGKYKDRATKAGAARRQREHEARKKARGAEQCSCGDPLNVKGEQVCTKCLFIGEDR
jgi:hypothetical protein